MVVTEIGTSASPGRKRRVPSRVHSALFTTTGPLIMRSVARAKVRTNFDQKVGNFFLAFLLRLPQFVQNKGQNLWEEI